MQNQKTVRTVLPLLERIAGDYTTESYSKSEVTGYAFQVDTSAATNGTTLSVQVQHSLDGILWHNLSTAATATISASVKGLLTQGTTIAPMVRAVVSLGVNTSYFSVIVYSAGV